ncbi:hypothetical protein BVI2075_180195 [Burkholderia vietnamiensis]|nr:hypothetical protein BVI2075_180195 [Burkholderia vietnamiensis]
MLDPFPEHFDANPKHLFESE